MIKLIQAVLVQKLNDEDLLFFSLSVQQMTWLGTSRRRLGPECCPTQLAKMGWVVWIFSTVQCLAERFQFRLCQDTLQDAETCCDFTADFLTVW